MSERGYGGQAAIDRMKARLDEPGRCLNCGDPLPEGDESHPDCYRRPKKVWVETIAPGRMMTHYVGDECAPDGHAKEMHGGQ